MSMEKVGAVSDEEKDDILKLYERKLALNELVLTLENQWVTRELRNKIHNKISTDIIKVNMLSERWWNKKAMEYNWKSHKNGKWTIDFKTNEIFLVK